MKEMLSSFVISTLLYFIMFQAINLYQLALASEPIDPTEGFISLPINQSNFEIQRPYDVAEDQRYSFIDGVHKLWVLKTDKPHMPTSMTNPRTEIRITRYDWSSGVWQFEGYGYVPSGTSGVCIMQVFGSAPPTATTLILNVYNGSLTYYKAPVLVPNIYDKWFRLNVIHDADANSVKVYIDSVLTYEAPGKTGATHYFKCGVYAQDHASNCMESRWKHIKVFKKM